MDADFFPDNSALRQSEKYILCFTKTHSLQQRLSIVQENVSQIVLKCLLKVIRIPAVGN